MWPHQSSFLVGLRELGEGYGSRCEKLFIIGGAPRMHAMHSVLAAAVVVCELLLHLWHHLVLFQSSHSGVVVHCMGLHTLQWTVLRSC
jgi:hypothetical protein